MGPRDRIDVPTGAFVLAVPPIPEVADRPALHADDDDERGGAQ